MNILRIILFGLFVIGIIIFVAFVVLNKKLDFHKPTGQYGVGKFTAHWTDKNRKDLNAINIETEYREIMTYIYYPTNDPIKLSPYDQDALNNAKEFIFSINSVPTCFLKGLNNLKVYAQNNAKIASTENPYPVIIFSHGAGPIAQSYTWLLEELASHGYIVIGINHPYVAAITRFPDGHIIKGAFSSKKKDGRKAYVAWKKEQINQCVMDVDFVISQLKEINNRENNLLKGAVDTTRIGVCGHSFGASIAMRAALKNKKINAIAYMDGGSFWYDKKIETIKCSVPCVVILGEKSHQWAGENERLDRQMLDYFCNINHTTVSQIVINNAGHGIFSDLPILLNTTYFTWLLSLLFDFDLEQNASNACTSLNKAGKILLDFFDQYLKKQNP